MSWQVVRSMSHHVSNTLEFLLPLCMLWRLTLWRHTQSTSVDTFYWVVFYDHSSSSSCLPLPRQDPKNGPSAYSLHLETHFWWQLPPSYQCTSRWVGPWSCCLVVECNWSLAFSVAYPLQNQSSAKGCELELRRNCFSSRNQKIPLDRNHSLDVMLNWAHKNHVGVRNYVTNAGCRISFLTLMTLFFY